MQLLEVCLLAVMLVGVPAAPKDAQPLERRGAEDGVMAGAFAALLFIVGLGPRTEEDGLAGPLDEGLAQEGGARSSASESSSGHRSSP